MLSKISENVFKKGKLYINGTADMSGSAFSIKHLHETFLGWTCEVVGCYHFHLPNHNKKGQTTGQINAILRAITEVRLQGTPLPNGNCNKLLEAPCQLA